ncbi:hypothetical protein Vadar_020599 [Vaccinium darrowii]|uniref:Uncharacterized protein n=1 Tax=Vaccinium darrowii TaxID=229202 RepID=A0ACB7YEN8_9ERIC|nr:hypothetical protein Vadar_020599 [Vaccinium darrowii]
MVKSCESAQDAEFVLHILRTMNNTNVVGDGEIKFKLTLRCYTMMLMSLSRFLMIDEMKSVYAEILDDKIPPNIYTFNTMLNAYCKLGDVVQAELYLSKILQAGLRPDVHTYTSLILGHCRRKDVDRRIDEALKLFAHMEDDDCHPTVRTYTVLICALCGSGRKTEALNLFEEMDEKGCEPNVHTYTVLIDNMCRDNKLDKAKEMFDAMSEKGLIPSVVTYNALIIGYCKEGLIDGAFEGRVEDAHCLLDSLEEKGMRANEVIFTALIDGYCKADKIDSACSLLEKMLAEDCFANSWTLNVLNILDQMVSLGLKPDVCTYTSFLVAYCNQGKLKEAEEVMAKMKEEGVLPDYMTYTALIDGYARGGLMHRAFDIFKCMVDTGCEPSHYAYSVLIKHLVKEKWLKEGRHGIGQELNPNVISINIGEVWKLMEFDTALALFEKMNEHGCTPNAKTYAALIIGLSREGRFEEAWRLVDHMKKRGISPSEDIYNTLVKCCCNLQMYGEAIQKISNSQSK